jgi:hypothetical protein
MSDAKDTMYVSAIGADAVLVVDYIKPTNDKPAWHDVYVCDSDGNLIFRVATYRIRGAIEHLIPLWTTTAIGRLSDWQNGTTMRWVGWPSLTEFERRSDGDVPTVVADDLMCRWLGVEEP